MSDKTPDIYQAKAPSKRVDQLGFRPKRFWAVVSLTAEAGGYAVALDGKPVKTPMGKPLILPNQATAQAVADEWVAVDGHVDFEAMPMTRLGFAAIDRMDEQLEAAVTEALRFAETDLLCYPADYPSALIERETAAWGPILERLKTDAGLELIQNKTLIHKPQPQATLDKIQSLICEVSAFERAGIMAAMPLFGSISLAIALSRGYLTGDAAFAASRVGEDFQSETWGLDEEAVQKANSLKAFARDLELWFGFLKA